METTTTASIPAAPDASPATPLPSLTDAELDRAMKHTSRIDRARMKRNHAKRQAEREMMERLDQINSDINDYLSAIERQEVEAMIDQLRGLEIMPLSDVPPEQVKWLWHGRVPLGKLTVIAGDPGLGKSFLALHMAARVSTGGYWTDSGFVPDNVVPHLGCFSNNGMPADVLLLSAEDDLGDTIRPRLEAMRADLTRICAITGVRVPEPAPLELPVAPEATTPEALAAEAAARKAARKIVAKVCPGFSLAKDIAQLDRELSRRTGRNRVRLVIIDPISAYLGRTDAHRDSEVRALLTPLAELAAKHEVAVVAVMHLNKNGAGKAITRTMGSLAFAAAARVVWLVSKDPLDPDRRLLLPVKINIAKEARGLGYRIVDGCVQWDHAEVNITADQALCGSGPGDGTIEDDHATEQEMRRIEAERFLRERLAGGPVDAAIITDAAAIAGVGAAQLRKAKQALGVKSERRGEGWCWSLPPEPKDGGEIGGQAAGEKPVVT